MAERVTQAWQTIPHFYLQRDVNAARLSAWRTEAQGRASEKLTYTDLLIKLIAAALTLVGILLSDILYALVDPRIRLQ